MWNFNRFRFLEFIIVSDRKVDLSLKLESDALRVKETGLRSNEHIYRDKPNWREALKALRDHKLKKCANILSKELLEKDSKQIIDHKCLRISDSYIVGPTCVIYQLKGAENDSKNNSSGVAGSE